MRYNHSSRNSWNRSGALLICPASKSIVAPSGRKSFTLFNSYLYLEIHFSCFGAPTPTNRTVASVLLIISNILAHSSSSFSKPNDGE